MKKILIIFFLFTGIEIKADSLKVNASAEAVVVMNADTGAIIYEKNSRVLYHPGSVTKIATALYALKEKGDNLDTILTAEQDDIGSVAAEIKLKSNTIPSYRLTKRASHVGIKAGEKMTFRDLLYGLMVASGDDAANIISRYVGGTIPHFMKELNDYLKTIGCMNTNYMNPHGLDDHEHKTTAYDVAILTREALKNPMFCKLVSTVSYERPKTNKQEATTWIQTNRLLRKGPYYYPKAIGVKTGYEFMALYNLVAAAKHEDRTIIVVLLHAQERKDTFQDAINIFDAVFNQKKIQKTVVKSGHKPYSLNTEGLSKPIPTYTRDEVTIEYYPSEEPSIKAQLIWDNVNLPIAKDQRLGEIRVIDDKNHLISSIPLYASENAQLTWMSRFKSLFFSGH